MTATAAPPEVSSSSHAPARPGTWTWALPVVLGAILAGAYVIVSPPTQDLAAHLFRAHLFAQQGFGLWNDYWYGGHHLPGYSVLFPAVSALLSPQLAAALAATGTAAVFAPFARRHFGERAWLGAVVFAAATAINLYTGRLPLAFGALPALAAVAALDRGHTGPAAGLALVAALCSPVAALFAALAALGYALAAAIADHGVRPAIPGAVVATAALLPVALLAGAFPEGGTEPFAIATLLPVLAVCVAGFVAAPRSDTALRAGIAVYGLAAVAAYLIPSPVGSNIARMGTLLAAPMAVLLWWRRRPLLLAAAVVPLLYIGWQAPVRDVAAVAGDPAASAGYYQPLVRFLSAQPGAGARRFRIEIPFTNSHWEADRVATRFPLARGWERQLDVADNPLFYDGRLTAASYERWLRANAVRFVALPDAALDYSARREAALVRGGLPYLRPVMQSAHWRVYAVAGDVPIAQGAASLTAMGGDWLALDVHRAGTVTIHVRFTPYWALAGGSGCVAPAAGDETRVIVRHPGPLRLTMRFALDRVGARSPRCT